MMSQGEDSVHGRSLLDQQINLKTMVHTIDYLTLLRMVEKVPVDMVMHKCSGLGKEEHQSVWDKVVNQAEWDTVRHHCFRAEALLPDRPLAS